MPKITIDITENTMKNLERIKCFAECTFLDPIDYDYCITQAINFWVNNNLPKIK